MLPVSKSAEPPLRFVGALEVHLGVWARTHCSESCEELSFLLLILPFQFLLLVRTVFSLSGCPGL